MLLLLGRNNTGSGMVAASLMQAMVGAVAPLLVIIVMLALAVVLSSGRQCWCWPVSLLLSVVGPLLSLLMVVVVLTMLVVVVVVMHCGWGEWGM